MKTILFGLAAALLGTAPALADGHASEKPQVLKVVTSADPQTQLMAMVLTMQAAQKGAATRILLCGPAGDIALDDAPASATTGQPPRDMSPQGLMQMIMANTGTTVEVCAIYLPGKGLQAEALIDGVGVADPAAMGALIADPAVKVISY